MTCLQRSWPLAAEGLVRTDGLPLPMCGKALSPIAYRGSSGGDWVYPCFRYPHIYGLASTGVEDWRHCKAAIGAEKAWPALHNGRLQSVARVALARGRLTEAHKDVASPEDVHEQVGPLASRGATSALARAPSSGACCLSCLCSSAVPFAQGV